ncbi:MAG TPA: hypothetical protein VKX28_03575 [Xanthobacteraceae bacterium]|nr:hypothetical protein [Xanthobacteraceae bacterium]
MAKRDVTKLNVAIDKLLETTTNPRHRFLLQAYSRHRYLEVAGRYEEIFAPDMMVQNPSYHFQAGGMDAKLEGQENVKSLYRTWADTNQSIFYAENEQVAVADNFVASIAIIHQQVSGKSLMFNKAISYLPGFLSEMVLKKVLSRKHMAADENAMYLYSNVMEMVWPYDDRCRLIGEDVWEPDPDKANIVKLDPADVMTTSESAQALGPLIKPLPSFDEMVLGRQKVAI